MQVVLFFVVAMFVYLFFSSSRLNKLKKKLARLHPEGEQYEPQSHYEGVQLFACFYCKFPHWSVNNTVLYTTIFS